MSNKVLDKSCYSSYNTYFKTTKGIKQWQQHYGLKNIDQIQLITTFLEINNKKIKFKGGLLKKAFRIYCSVEVLDEADYLSLNAQAGLRAVMEEYHSTSRFVLTCNYPHKIIPAIHSRCQGFHIDKVDNVEFTSRVATILIEENIIFELDVLDTFVQASYPDLRKCINSVQMNSLSGTLVLPKSGDSNSLDYKIKMIDLFKSGKISEARELVCANARPEEMEDIYRWLYDNVQIFGDEQKQDKAVLIIKQGLVDHTIIADAEINLAATLIRLNNL